MEDNKDIFDQLDNIDAEAQAQAQAQMPPQQEQSQGKAPEGVANDTLSESDVASTDSGKQLIEPMDLSFSTVSPKEVKDKNGVKIENAGDKVVEVLKIEMMQPIRSMRNQNGMMERVPPKKIVDEKTKNVTGYYYDIYTKFWFRMGDEDNLVERYSGLKVFTDEEGEPIIPPGQVKPSIRIYREGVNSISTVFKYWVCFMSKGQFKMEKTRFNGKDYMDVNKDKKKEFLKFADQFSDEDFRNAMIGKKVKLYEEKGNWQGKDWVHYYINEIVA